jgi:tRNA-binding protein
MVTIDDFHKIDVRVGKVINVEDYPEARKPTYILTIDFGKEVGVKRSCAGLVKNYHKEDLIGKKVLGVVNLPPRQMGKVFSEVLTLGVPDEDNECVLIVPDKDKAIISGKLY